MMMSASRHPGIRMAFTVAVALLSAGVAACTQSSIQSPMRAMPATHPIQHVIIIVQENRSFDNMFNGFPGADTVTVGQTKLGPQPLAPVPYVDGSLDNGHFHTSFVAAYVVSPRRGTIAVELGKLED